MACKLATDNEPTTIPMKDLPGGKLAVIVEGDWKGAIVQKRNGRDRFLIIGEDNGFSGEVPARIQVRILEEGELIEVKYS